MGIKSWGCWTVAGLVLGYCIGVGAVARGQEVPSAPPAGGLSGTGTTSTVLAPIFLGFPSPIVPVGEPVGQIAPMRPLQFAPLPDGTSPLQFRATASVQEEYTDNANETKTNKVGMFRTSLIPGLSGHAEGSRSTLDLAYAPRILFQNAVTNQSANTASDNTVQQYLTLRGGLAPTPEFQFNAAEDFTYSNDFRTAGSLGTTRTGQNRYTLNQASLVGAYVPVWGRMGVGYTNVLAQNDVVGANNSISHNMRMSGELNDPRYSLGGAYTLVRGIYTQASSNYWGNSGEANAKRLLTPTLSATLSGQFTDHQTDQPLNQNYQTGGGMVGGVWAYSPDGSISAQAGMNVYSPQSGGTTARPGAVALWTQRLTYVALTARFEQSFQQDFQSVDNTGVSLTRSASVYLTTLTLRQLTATIGGRWYWQDFQQTTVTGGPSGTKQNTWDLQARLEYILARPLVISLDYSYTIRSSSVPTAAFVENRVSLGLSYRYDIF
jgi:Putative beta-barrel porin 2